MSRPPNQSAAESRNVLVLVHGYLDGPDVWQRLLGQLRLPGWDSVVCRLERATDGEAVSADILECYARQVLAHIEAAGVAAPSRLVLVGHSMGAQVAELAAAELVGRVAGLARVTPAPLAGYPLAPEIQSRFESRAVLRDASAIGPGKRGMAEALDDAAVDILVAATLATGPDTALEQLRAWTGGHPAGHRPSDITVPVLTVATDDRFFTADMLEQGSSRFRHRAFTRISGAGHWPQLEQPAALAEALERFVTDLP